MNPDPDPDDRAEPAGRVRPMPEADQRRLYRPEDLADERRPIFHDWAAI